MLWLLLLLLRLVVMVCTRTGYGQPGWDSGRQQRTRRRRDHVAVVVVTIAAGVDVVVGAARNGTGTVGLLL